MSKKTVKDILSAFLKKTGMDEGKVAALFNADGSEFADNAEAELTQFDATRVEKIKSSSKTEGFNEGHGKGLREGASKWEDEAKKEFEITSDKKGIELIREVVAAKSTVKPELEEDKVKAHPVYVKMERELKSKISQVDGDWKTKYETRDTEIAKEKTLASVFSKARTKVTSLKPVLPKDSEKAEKQLRMLESELKGFEYKDVDGEFVVIKDGKPLEDKHGSKIKFDDLVKGIAGSIWDFEEGESRSSAGNNNDGKGGNKSPAKTPANETEYNDAIRNAKTPEERIAIDDAYTKSQTVTV